MIETKRFAGILNLDDKEVNILPIQHIDCINGRFFGGQQGLSFQNIKGNYLIDNNDLPAGTNECIGSFFDQINQRIIWFNYNSNGNNGIYQLLIQTGVVSKIFLCNTDSATDILRFSLDYPITSAVIVYRTEGDGDLLYWTDGNVGDENRPRYLNIDTVATLAPFTEDMINAAKLPPLVPPTASYVSDSSFGANRVKNKYFQFAYRWTYKSLEKSTFSPFSTVAIPPNITNPQADIQSNTNNAIDVTVISAATDDFQSLEIAARVWLGSAWSDFFLVQTVTVDDISTPIPFSYSYRFFNNGTYANIPTDESDLYFDWLPDYANAMELLNGNVLIYGGITDGYNSLTRQQVDVQVTATGINSPFYPAVSSVWKDGQYQRLGLQYFDKRGKPIGGVVSFLADATIDTTNFDVTTGGYAGEVNGVNYPITRLDTVINHIPPQDAESYCWVRANLTPIFFLQWVTNDFQDDVTNGFLYFCIQSLIEANNENAFLPSYEFTEGDRLTAKGVWTSTENVTVYVPQLDFQILGVEQRVMQNGNPASSGAFLKVKRPASFPTPSYNRNTFIEIYTPPAGLTDNNTLFYEWGQRYGFQTILGVKYHLGGTQNQTASVPALTEFSNGDCYLKQRQIYPTVGATGTYTVMVWDRRYNDYQESAANSNGRAWLINEDAREEYNGVLSRWGGKYQSGTNINNLNRFRPNDYDEADRSKGDIRRYKARDRILRVFQDRGCGQYGIYARFIQNNAGEPELVTTNEIITTNNIQYYQGTYGLGGYATNLCSTAIADYFADIVTGREVRLSGDGITDLGLLYKGQFTLANYVTPYNKEILRADGSIAKVMKFWDSFENEAHTILQAGTLSGTNYPDRNYSFNETRNGFTGFYDYHPEWALSANDIIYSWKEGEIYKHDVSGSNYCNFYGTQYDCYITLVFNMNVGQKKSFQSIAEVASTTWICPTIYTDTNSYGTQRQESNLTEYEFAILEGMPSTSLKRDSNSNGGKINGQVLKGNYIVIKFQKTNASDLVTLTEIQLKSIDSPLNVQ